MVATFLDSRIQGEVFDFGTARRGVGEICDGHFRIRLATPAMSAKPILSKPDMRSGNDTSQKRTKAKEAGVYEGFYLCTFRQLSSSDVTVTYLNARPYRTCDNALLAPLGSASLPKSIVEFVKSATETQILRVNLRIRFDFGAWTYRLLRATG